MTSQHYLIPGINDLINRIRQARGWSYATLADRSAGHISRQRWHQLANADRIKEFPEPATITSIAETLDIDVSTVVLALAKTIGLDVKPVASAVDFLPPEADLLNGEQREAVRIVIKAMVSHT